MRTQFVKSVLDALVKDGTVGPLTNLLAVCAGTAEKDLFEVMGFSDVVISNLDERMTEAQMAPFGWSRQDAQALSFSDGSFDVVFVADGLHHCSSPHRALLEMYRVARRAIVVIESRDSALMRLANRLGLSPEYEIEAVIGNVFAYGGVDNTPVPNYIYRWTEAEFKKTICSYNPMGRHRFQFFYGLNLPHESAKFKKTRFKSVVLWLVVPFLRLFTFVFKRQCNSFAMVATKPELPHDRWPWLKEENGQTVLDRAWAAKRFRVNNQ